MLFGWAAGALLLLAATAIVQLAQHRPLQRIAFNVAVLALVALAAGALIAPIHGESVGAVIARVVVAATADNIVNIVLISAAIALSTNQPYLKLMKTHVRATIVPFAFMASAALMLVVLWERSPMLSVALVGPLLAIALYQRSTHRALRAMRLALTDPLTGLGNHRHFHERLQRELLNAEEQARPLTLCFVDIDDFKRINDRFGHPSGDRVLSQIATRLRQGGEAFRLGGDEFALLLADHDEATALTAAESIVERIATVDFDHIGQVTVSAGSRDVPGAGSRPRRADPARRQRPVLGQGARQEPRAALPPGHRRARRAEAARRRAGQGRALPRRGFAREGGRRTRHLHRQPLRTR